MATKMIQDKKNISKRSLAILILLGVLIVLVSLLLYHHSQLVHRQLLEGVDKIFRFNSPYLVTLDSKNNICLVDNRSKRLTKMTPNGEVLFSIDGGKRSKGNFYLLLDTALDSQDYIYILNVIVDLADGYPGVYEILRYTPSGIYDQTIFRYDRSKAERIETKDGYILGNIQVKEGYVYFVFYEQAKGSQFMRIPITGGKAEKVLTMQGRIDFISMVGTDPGAIYLTKLDGKIYTVESNGTLTPFQEAAQAMNAPWGLRIGGAKNLYVTDVDSQSFYAISPDRRIEPFITKRSLAVQGYQVSNVVFRYFSLNPSDSITVVDELNNAILTFNSHGKIMNRLNQGFFSSKSLFLEMLYKAEWVLFILLILGMVTLFYVSVLDRRLPLVFKQLFVFIPIIAISILIASNRTYRMMYDKQLSALYDHVAMIAQIGADKIDGDALERVTKPEHFMGKDYLKVHGQMHAIMNDNQDKWNELPYSRIYKFKNGLCYITVDWSSRYGVLYPFTYAQPVHRDAYNLGKIGFTHYSDFDSDLIVGVAPIKNSHGIITGVYEVMVDYYILDEIQKEFFRKLLQNLLISLLVFIAVFSAFTFIILIALGRLRNALIEVSSGKWDASIDIRSRDEIEDLGIGFNLMAGQIRQYITEITNLNRAYVKFVPSEFLKYLGKQSILQINLGDQVQKEMAVLFSDIRSFTSLSESMTPKENFDFINGYLKRMGPVIRNHHGFIDKYIGDAIMALFADDSGNAVKAGIEMKKVLAEYNKKRVKDGHKVINIGVGIHTGLLMLGTVGEEERMNGTVISDNVNLASRLEGLTKMYGAGIIISENSFQQIDASKYLYRFLDKVRVKGKNEPVSIYEILDGESPEDQDLKVKTRDIFHQALRSYQKGQFQNAIRQFQEVLAVNSHDKACTLFIQRCEKYLHAGVPENWDGAEHLDEK